jgi:hypothetical protein
VIERLRRDALWAAVYLAAAFVRLAPLSLHPATRIADQGDAYMETWVAWWTSGNLWRGWPGIFGANAFFPHPDGLLYQEPLLAQSVLGWPLFHALGPVLALNLVTIATFALSAFAFHLYAREWVESDSAAAVGAVLYAFNAYTAANIARVHIVSLGWLPLALLALHRLFTRADVRWAAPLALFSVLHGLSCLYYLTFYLLVLGVLVPVYFATTRAWRRPAVLAALGASGVLIAAVIGLLAIPYLRLFHRYGFSAEVRPFDLFLYLTPPTGSFVYGALGDKMRPAGFYVDFFLGYAALGLAALGIVAVLGGRRHAKARPFWIAWLVLGLAAAALSAGVDVRWRGAHIGTGPYALLQGVPPFSQLREPRRLAVLVLFSVSLFAAAGVGALGCRLALRARIALGGMLALLVAAEHWSLVRTEGGAVPVGASVPDAYRWLRERPGAEAVADLPARPAWLYRFMALDQYFSTVHAKPIVTGWPSFFPPALELLLWDLRDFPDDRSIALLRAMGVRLVVVHPKRWGEARETFERGLAEREDALPLLARFPDRAEPGWDHYGLGAEEVRMVPGPAEDPPPRECACREVDRGHYRLKASGGTRADLAADGELRTRWTSQDPQHRGVWFEVVLDRPVDIARVEIEMAHPYGEFARDLEITGRRGAETWPMGPLPDTGYDIRLLRQLIADPVGARLRYYLRPAPVDALRLSIARTEDGAPPWSIREIHVYALAAPPSP